MKHVRQQRVANRFTNVFLTTFPKPSLYRRTDMNLRIKTLLTAASAMLGLGLAQQSQSAIIINFNQVGSDVVMTTSGTLNLTGATEAGQNVNIGATQDIAGSRITVGSGTAADTNLFYMNRINLSPVAAGLTGTLDSWSSTYTDVSAANATVPLNSIRFAQLSTGSGFSSDNANRIFVADAVDAGDVLNINSQATFANKTLADFGLVDGTNVEWLRVRNGGSNGDSVFITATPEPGSLALLGFGGLLIGARRRRG